MSCFFQSKKWKGDVLKNIYLNKGKKISPFISYLLTTNFPESGSEMLPGQVFSPSQGGAHPIYSQRSHLGAISSLQTVWSGCFFHLWERGGVLEENLHRHRGNIWTPRGAVPEPNQEPPCLEVTANLWICMRAWRSQLSSCLSDRFMFTRG